jgi:glycosyltransferase involved in cell wall biosynthesis
MFEPEINPAKVTRADLVVAIPSFDEAESIGRTALQTNEGLLRFFPDKASVIINCDNHSSDGTRDSFLTTPTDVPKIYISTPPGVRGKGSNLRNLFRKVIELEAKAVVVLDADLKTVRPEWIKHLAEPLFGGYAYVAPLYVKHKYDDPLTSAVVYPLIRALYGRRIRQPVGGEFGFTGDLAKAFHSCNVWSEAASRFGIDAWMTIVALQQRVQFCQSFLGSPKLDRPKDPSVSPGPVFRDIISTIFSLMPHFEGQWTRVKYSKPTAIYGFGVGAVEKPPKVEVDTERLIHRFHEGFGHHRELWERALSKDIYMKLLEMKGMRKEVFSFPADLWARLLYDMALFHRDAPGDRETALESLMPLYCGRVFSCVRKTKSLSTRLAEESVEEDCMAFEMTKPYLVRRWREGKEIQD